jgi:hypothetical protein
MTVMGPLTNSSRACIFLRPLATGFVCVVNVFASNGRAQQLWP